MQVTYETRHKKNHLISTVAFRNTSKTTFDHKITGYPPKPCHIATRTQISEIHREKYLQETWNWRKIAFKATIGRFFVSCTRNSFRFCRKLRSNRIAAESGKNRVNGAATIRKKCTHTYRWHFPQIARTGLHTMHLTFRNRIDQYELTAGGARAPRRGQTAKRRARAQFKSTRRLRFGKYLLLDDTTVQTAAVVSVETGRGFPSIIHIHFSLLTNNYSNKNKFLNNFRLIITHNFNVQLL